MLRIRGIAESEEGLQILIFCKLDEESDLEILSFIIASICNSHFCMEYSAEETLEILKEITKDKEIFGKNLVFGVGRYKGEIAFLFGD